MKSVHNRRTEKKIYIGQSTRLYLYITDSFFLHITKQMATVLKHMFNLKSGSSASGIFLLHITAFLLSNYSCQQLAIR